MLAVLVALSGGTLAEGVVGANSGAAEALDAPQMDPQLVISRESLIASMTEPGGHSAAVASDGESTLGTASTSSSHTEQAAPARAAAAGGYSQKHNRPLPVETALSAVSAAVDGTTDSQQPADLRQEQHQQQASETQQQAGHALALPDGSAAAKQPIVTITTASAGSADRQTSGKAAKAQGLGGDAQEQREQGDDDDANDEELTVGAGGEPHVRWLDCKVWNGASDGATARTPLHAPLVLDGWKAQ